MRRSHRQSPLLLLLFAVSALPARAAIVTPGCDALAAWAASMDAEATYAVTPALSLPQAMATETMQTLFGQPPLAWTGEDVLAARRALNECRQVARRAGQQEQAKALADVTRVVAGRLRDVVRKVRRARAAVEQQRAAIDGLTDSPHVGRAVHILLAGDPAMPRAIRQSLGEVDRAVARPFRELAGVLPNLPPTDRELLFAALGQRASGAVAAVATDATTAAEATTDVDDAGDAAAASDPCEAVGAWAESIDEQDRFEVTPAHDLPAALAPDRLRAVFGRATLEWSGEDLQAARKTINECAGEARRQGRKERQQALSAANTLVARSLRALLGQVRRARDKAAARHEDILGLPFTPALYRATATVVARDPLDAGGTQAALAGLELEVQRAFADLARALPDLPHEERHVLFASLGERVRSAEAELLADAGERIRSAPQTAAGVLALERLRLELSAYAAAGSTRLAAAAEGAGERLVASRAALAGAAAPAWRPPTCEHLYAWAGSDDALDYVQAGGSAWRRALEDERVQPLFGLALPAWSEEHLQQFIALASLCRARVDALAESERQVRNPPADAPELVRLASRGRWLVNGERELRQAQAAMRARGDALAEIQSLRERIAALPGELAALGELARLQRTPAAAMLTPAERRDFDQHVRTHRSRIATAVEAAVVAEMEAIEVGLPADLGRLWNFRERAARRLPGQSLAAFERRFRQRLSAAAGEVLPRFHEALRAVPDTEAGLASLGGLIGEVTGVPREGYAMLPGYGEAVAARAQAVADTLARQRCDALWASLELATEDAALPVWDGGDGTTLGQLVCGLAEHGHAVSSFEASGLLSAVSTLAVTLQGGTFQRVSLHEGEVAPDTRMLVGFEISDANETRRLSVAEWERFVARNATAEAGAVDCERVLNTPVEQLSVNERMAVMGCVFGAALREMQGR